MVAPSSLPHSRSPRQIRSSAEIVLASALIVALATVCLCLGVEPAAAAKFHSCASQDLANKGISQLRASHAKCRLARQVALARRGGDKTPKGFSCKSGSGSGGDVTAFTCSQQDRVVRFLLLKSAS